MRRSPFADKGVVITGASSGLGRALAHDLAGRGARLFLCGRNRGRLHAVERETRSRGIFYGDLGREANIARMVASAIKILGRIDYLILNAGVSMNLPFQSIRGTAIAHKIFQLNFISPAHTLSAALNHLRQSAALVVGVASVQALVGAPYHSYYAASKHALVGLLKSLRMEAPEVDFLVVYPGWIRDTSLRKNRIQKKGGARASVSHGLPLEQCSSAIVKAMASRKRELWLPHYLHLLHYLTLWFPRFTDRLIFKRVTRSLSR